MKVVALKIDVLLRAGICGMGDGRLSVCSTVRRSSCGLIILCTVVYHDVCIFVGHAGHETVDYAMANIPLEVKSKLEALLEETELATKPLSPDLVSSLLGDTISEFDDSLREDLLALFPGGFEGALKLSGEEIEEIINDADRGGHNLKKVHRCMRGSTALISLVDPPGENLWVANLGDCEAGQQIYSLSVLIFRWSIFPSL
jgi:hypothetical protein